MYRQQVSNRQQDAESLLKQAQNGLREFLVLTASDGLVAREEQVQVARRHRRRAELARDLHLPPVHQPAEVVHP